jgi:3-phosphoshikimate 1-carboxyvinyltransferase
MKLAAVPANPLVGAVSLPGDKSISHRAALLAALAVGESRIDNFLLAGVTKVMLEALQELGIIWNLDGRTLNVKGRGLQRHNCFINPIRLDCGNSGTTLRLLAGALSAMGIPAILDGSAGLRSRPMKRIVEPLQSMGVPIQASPENTAPLSLGGRPSSQKLKPLNYNLPVASAQVKSCLLLAALDADGPSTLREPGPSRDHTERMLRAMKVAVASQPENPSFARDRQYEICLTPPNPLQLKPLSIDIPGDISSAAFLIVAALITPGSKITIKHVGLNPTRTGLLEALLSMGADLMIFNQTESNGEPVGDLQIQYQPLHGTHISGSLVVRMIDEFPIFAIAAANARGQTVISEAAELRYKESDRISDLCKELIQMGVELQEKPDGFVVYGGETIKGGRADPHGDHRLAMALTVAGLAACDPVIVENAEIITESFPEFGATLLELGADIRFE